MTPLAASLAALTVAGAGSIFTLPALVVDQSAPAEPGAAPFTFAVGGNVDQVISQTVTAGVDGRLRAVHVPIGCESGMLILEIRDVNAATDQPGATVLARRLFAAESFPPPVTSDFRELRVSGRLQFAAGDRFAIVLSNPTGSCGIWPGPIGDTYAAGTGWADASDGPIVPLGSGSGREDLPFQTVMRVD